MTGGLTSIDYGILAVYLLGMVALGFHFGRGQKGTESYFLAGRSMGWFPIAISLIATLVSTSSFLAFPSEAYGHDMKILAYIFGVPLALLVIQKVFIPLYMRMNITSAYEYLEKRFNVGLRTTTSALFALMRLLWMAVAVHAASLAVFAMMGLKNPAHMTVIIFAIGVLAIMYVTVGGMKAVIWTDVVQFFLFAGALAGTCVYVAFKLDGGLGEIFRVCGDAGKFDVLTREFFTPDPRIRITFWSAVLTSFTWMLATYGSDQVVVQRYLSSRNARQATGSIWGNFVFGDIVLTLFQVGAGLALFAFYRHFTGLLPDGIPADKVFPHFIANQLPVGISGLILAALFAAIMSSIDSGINSIAAVATIDFYRRFSTDKPSARAEVRFARVLTPLLGLAVCVLAAFVVGGTGSNILERGQRALGFLVGPILGTFLLGLFSRRANSWGTFVGVVLGIASGVLVAFAHRLGLPELSFQLVLPASVAGTVVFGVLASRFWPAPDQDRLKGLVYGLGEPPGR